MFLQIKIFAAFVRLRLVLGLNEVRFTFIKKKEFSAVYKFDC